MRGGDTVGTSVVRLCCIGLVIAFGTALISSQPSSLAWGASPPPRPAAATVSAGTVLHLRLQTAVSTKASKKGDIVTATVARSVTTQGGVTIPVGAALKGKIEKCSQPTAPDERAELLITFGDLEIPGESKIKVTGHLTAVSNARETLTDDGTIVGVLKTEAPVTLLSGALQKLNTMNPTLAKEIQKQKIGEVNTTIEYPVGTDVQFTLAEAISVERLSSQPGPAGLPSELRGFLANFLSSAPQRSQSKDNKPGDPINLIFVGSAHDIEEAFRQVGWLEPKRKDGISIFDTARAVMHNEGYGAAPISDLYLYGRKEDMAFEKMLNTFNKRHHLRLWQAPVQAPDGRPIWLGAATHDTGLDIRPGVVSHATDPNLDDEREQIGADLVASGIVQATDLVSRPNPLTSGVTATGGDWHTDGRLLAVSLKTAVVSAK